MQIDTDKIVDMHEDIMHSLISLNCEMIRLRKNVQDNVERLKQDIQENENICPMKTCIWNIKGTCSQNGMYNLIKQCRESNYKFFESDNNKTQVNSGYLGKC